MDKPLILIVEESQYIDDLKNSLEAKYSLLTAKTSDEAVKFFTQYKGRIDIALLSYSLFGLEIVKEMDNISYKDIPDIIMSADGQDSEAAIKAMTKGLAFDYISKPYDKTVLLEIIERVLHRKENDFIQKNKHRAKSDYLNAQFKDIKSQELQSLQERFGESFAKDKLFAYFREFKIAHKNLPLDVVLRVLEDDTGEIAPFPTVTKILIIEDEAPMREALKGILEERYCLYFAKDGKEALEKLNRIDDLDIILLDIGLPDIRGDELLKMINEKKELDKSENLVKGPDVIALTAYSDIKTITTICRDGATDYITKGDGKVAVLKVIEEVAAHRYYFKAIPKLLDILKNQRPCFKTRLHILNRRILEKAVFSTLNMGDIYKYFPDYQCDEYPQGKEVPYLTLETGLEEFILMLKERAIDQKIRQTGEELENIALSPLDFDIEMLPEDNVLKKISDQDIKDSKVKILVLESDSKKQNFYKDLFENIVEKVFFAASADEVSEVINQNYGKIAVILITDDKFNSFDRLKDIGLKIYELFKNECNMNMLSRKITLNDNLTLEEQYDLLKFGINKCLSKDIKPFDLIKVVKYYLKEKIGIEKEGAQIVRDREAAEQRNKQRR